MADIKRLEDALIQAHEAGNTEDAAILAEEIRRLRAASQPQRVEPQSGFLRGIRDPLDAGAQLLERALPEGAVSAVNQFNNWLVDQGVPLERLGPGGLEASLSRQEQAYQASRQGEGIDWARLGGNIVSPANLALGYSVPRAATLAGRIGSGAAAGAALGPLQSPTFGQDFWGQKARQAGYGAAGGAAVPAVTNAASRVISPKPSAPVQSLRDQGVRLTAGQRLGGLSKDIEDKATSVPVLGHAIQNARSRGLEDFNRRAIDKALTRAGLKPLPKDKGVGGDAMAHLQASLGKGYENLLDRMKGRVDQGLQRDVDNILDMARALPKDKQDYLRSVIEREINSRITDAGTFSGRSLKEIQSALGDEVVSFKNASGFDKKLQDALRELRESFMRSVARQNPGESARKLRNLDKSWHDFEIMTRASSSVGAEDGIFTPAQLYSAAKALDRSKNKRAFSQGRARMQQYAGEGKKVLPSKVPDSGTAGRLMVNSPMVGIPSALMGSVFAPMYTRTGQQAMDFLLNARPRGAQTIADFIQQSTPYAVPGGAAVGYGLFGEPE